MRTLVTIFLRIAEAQERQAAAAERLADAHERIALAAVRPDGAGPRVRRNEQPAASASADEKSTNKPPQISDIARQQAKRRIRVRGY